jgi:hypothetical protein
VRPSTTCEDTTGVYVVVVDGVVKYVGQSVRRVRSRVNCHRRRFGGARFFVLDVPVWLGASRRKSSVWLLRLEAAVIGFFEPAHNKVRPAVDETMTGLVEWALFGELNTTERAEWLEARR